MSFDYGDYNDDVHDVYDESSTLRGLLATSGLQDFLNDEANTEIAVNRPHEIWTESSKGWQKHDAPKLDFAICKQIANAFAVYNKLEINQQKPICSGTLPDGQRGQIVIPSACELGTVSIVIRQPSQERFAFEDYLDTGRLENWKDVSLFQTKNVVIPDNQRDEYEAEQGEIERLREWLGIPDEVKLKLFELKMLEAKARRDIDSFIRLAVEHKQNICLIGATGSGKTTFTKAICDLVPLDTRIITIEDTHELDLPKHPNRVHMFYKDVTPKALIQSTMRMKPDRIFLTELRGDEAFDYLVALNTGHGGSITTVHANDCYSAYSRIATLVMQSESGKQMPTSEITRQVFTTIDVMIYLERTRVKELSYDPVRKFKLLQGDRALFN